MKTSGQAYPILKLIGRGRGISLMGTIRQQMTVLLEQQSLGVRDLSQQLGISEKDVYEHLEHIRRSVLNRGKRIETTPCECLSCGYVFTDRSRVKKPGRCPKCRQSHIQGPAFHISL